MSASFYAQSIREFFHFHGAWPSQYFEDRLSAVYQRILRPGDNAVDIGAHSGFHAATMAKCIGKKGYLICAEPLPEIFAELKQNMPSAANISLFNGVFSDKSGKVTFNRAVGIPGESGLRERRRYDAPNVKLETITVPSMTLDEGTSKLAHLRYVKIDTEGAELTILQAAPRVMTKLRPIISVEWGCDTYLPYGHEARSLFVFARSRNYSIFDLFTNMVKSEREWLDVSDRGSWDFILVPDEKLAEYVYGQS